MSGSGLSAPAWVAALKREWLLYHLGDPRFRFMWDPAPDQEWVALDCETTGLNVRTDDIIAIGAVRIRGNRIMTSERLELLVRPEKRRLSADSVRVHRLREQDVAQGLSADEAMMKLMHFIGSRPLVGYYLEFDMAMIHRVLFPMLGMGLPQKKIEVSAMYYDYKYQQLPHHARDSGAIDLRFDSLMKDLDLPLWPAHDALNDAIMAALAFLKLRQLRAG
ncbi:MAG: 3'-5' exonuclease [Polaromonas sp.]